MIEGVMLDIDGVLTVSWRPLPGAVDTIRWLLDQDIEFRLVTNTSSRSRRQIAALLDKAGMPVAQSRILTAVTGAGRYLAEHYPGAGCFVLNEGDGCEDLPDVRQVDAHSAEVILLGGAGPTIGYTELDAAFKRAIEGIPVIALHRNTRFQTSAGPALDMGAFIVGLEVAANVEVVVVGKPAPAFFAAALADLGSHPEKTVMVGDDIGSDVGGAQSAGIRGVLVRTGKFRPADLDGGVHPEEIIDDIGGFPALWPRLGGTS